MTIFKIFVFTAVFLFMASHANAFNFKKPSPSCACIKKNNLVKIVLRPAAASCPAVCGNAPR